MLVLSFDPFPTLTTDRFVLRNVSPNDVNEMFVMRSDPRIIPHRLPCQSSDEAMAYIQKLHDEQAIGKSITWVIQLKENPKLIGTVCFWNIQPEYDRAEIGYALLTDYHRQGIMTEVLPPVLKYGFETMKLHSVEGHVDPTNAGSVKVLERNGFVREGHFKENCKFPDGRYRDTYVYSLLAQNR